MIDSSSRKASDDSLRTVGHADMHSEATVKHWGFRFGLLELLLITAAIAAWIPVIVARRQIPVLETDIQLMQRATTDLIVEDETKLTVRALQSVWQDMGVWKYQIPPNANLELRMATEGINSLGLPQEFQTVALPAGQHTIQLKNIHNSEGQESIVSLDGVSVMWQQHPADWIASGASSSSTEVQNESGTYPLSEKLTLRETRYTWNHPLAKYQHAYVSPDHDHKGVLLWISPRGRNGPATPLFVATSPMGVQRSTGNRQGIRIGCSDQKGVVGLLTVQPSASSIMGDQRWGNSSRLAVSVYPIEESVTPTPREVKTNRNGAEPTGVPFVLTPSISPPGRGAPRLSNDEFVQQSIRGGGSKMGVFAHYQPFPSGAQPIVEVLFDSAHPDRVGFLPHAAPGSAPMKACQLVTQFDSRYFWRKIEVLGLSDADAELNAVPTRFISLKDVSPRANLSTGKRATTDAKETDHWQSVAMERLPWVGSSSTADISRTAENGKLRMRRLSLATDVMDSTKVKFPLGLNARWEYGGIANRQVWWLPAEQASGEPIDGVKVDVRSTLFFPTTDILLPGGPAVGNVRITIPMPATEPVWFAIVTDPTIVL